MGVQQNRLQVLLEKEKKKLIKKAEKGKLTKADLKKFPEEEREKYKKDIERRQSLVKYHRKKERLIKEGIIKRKRGKYFKTYICDECGIEFKLKYLNKKVERKYCSEQCRRESAAKLMRDKKLKKYISTSNKKKVEYKYKIIVTSNGIEKKQFGKYLDKKSAFEDYDRFIENSKNVVLSKRYSHRNKFEYKYELLLLKLNEEELKPTKFPNEYGKLVENVVEVNPELDMNEWKNKKREAKDWVILNKNKYNYEENFFVYGYEPKYDRKDITFILDNILLKDNEFKQISVYKNKLLIKNDSYIFDLIIGKNKNIIIDLYNKIEEICRKREIKHISFFGFSDGALSKDFTEKMIQEKTGWDMLKIRKTMSSN